MTAQSISQTKDRVQHAHTSTLVVPHAELGVLVVRGKDRASWVNGLVTCDVAKLLPGDAAYGLAVTQKGRIVTDMMIFLDADALLIAAPRTVLEEVRASFDHYLIMEDAEISEDDSDRSVWLAHGPRSRELIATVRAAGALAAPLDVTDLGGAIVIAPGRVRAEVEAALAKGVAEIGGEIGDDASWETLRVERGIARFGIDFDNATYPQEASLEKRAVSFSKGCYLGQEVVCMLEMRGHVKRKLVGIVFETGEVPARGANVVDDSGAAIGDVTSAALSATLGVPIALAMVKYAHANAGSKVRVGESKGVVVERAA